MVEKTLVVLAAGMGSRFGGMKQIEPVGPNGEFIIDYSVYSAIRYGFNKVVFVIKEENYDIFKETIGSRIENKISVEYSFQKLEDIPEGYQIPDGRVKPWGTAHAIYSARNYLNGNFGVITADDFYGDDAFKQLSEMLNENIYSIIGYNVGDTLSKNGAVKRGVVLHNEGIVSGIIESSCELNGEKVKCTPLDKSKEVFEIEVNHPVSMLINGFTTDILDTIGADMERAFRENKNDLSNYEMLLPDIMDEDIKNGKLVKVVNTNATWMGMTYREDCELVKNFIIKQIEAGVYPKVLWD